MKPLRWTVLASHVPPDGGLGGIVRYTVELLDALSHRSDVEVTAVTTPSSVESLRERLGDRARVVSVPAAPTSLLSVGERWSSRFSGPAADVIHGVKHLLPRRRDGFRVLTVHDMLLLDRPRDFGLSKRLLLPSIYRASLRDADLLVCVSSATLARLAVHASDSVAHAEVVHLATAPSLQVNDPVPTAALHGVRFALVVGDPTPRKNLRTVLAAWPALRAAVPDAVLAVAGPPSWGRTDVGPMWDSLVAAGAVVPLGHVTDGELRWAYENATVVLCPSLAEGFGLPVAEALSFGAPIVISDDAALREVGDGRARAVVPATDVPSWTTAIEDAFVHPSLREKRRLTGRNWADVADETVTAVRRRLC